MQNVKKSKQTNPANFHRLILSWCLNLVSCIYLNANQCCSAIGWSSCFLKLWRKKTCFVYSVCRGLTNQYDYLCSQMQLCLSKENSNLWLRHCAWRGNEKQMNETNEADFLSSRSDFAKFSLRRRGNNGKTAGEASAGPTPRSQPLAPC